MSMEEKLRDAVAALIGEYPEAANLLEVQAVAKVTVVNEGSEVEVDFNPERKEEKKMVLSFEIPADAAEELRELMSSFHGNLHYLMADALAEFSKARKVASHGLDLHGAEEYVERRYDRMDFFHASPQGQEERRTKIKEVASRCRASEILRNNVLSLTVQDLDEEDSQ